MVFALQLLSLLLFILQIHTQSQNLDTPKPCPSPMITLEGKCFPPIPGCQTYKSGTECQTCDQISTLTNGKCLLNSPIPDQQVRLQVKQKHLSAKGSVQEVKLDFIDQINLNTIKNLIFVKYPSFVNTSTQPFIRDITKTSYDTYYYLTWANTRNRTFLFQFAMSFDGTTTELISDDWDPNLENSVFAKIHAKLIFKYSKLLNESTLTRIDPISKNLFKLHYYSDTGFHYMSFIQKIPYMEIKPLETLPWKYDDQEMLQYIYSQHPFLLTETSWKIQKRDNQKKLQYQIRFSSQSQVVLEELPEQRQRIIFFKRQENQTLSPLANNSKIVGGVQILRDQSDNSVRSVLDHLLNEFTILKNLEVVKIEYQIVAGVIYLIHFKDKSINDQYICKVFYSLSGEINILEIYFNSILIHSQPLAPLQIDSYDFKTDPIFQEVDKFMRSQKNLSVPNKILYVNKVLKTNELNTFWMFEIVFESNSFMIASYFTEGSHKGTIELNDFIYNGDNQLDEEDKTNVTLAIKDYLSAYRPWLRPLIIEYLKESKPNEYLLKIMTKLGSYYFKVVDTELTNFEIYYYELIDERELCITHSIDYIEQFQLIEKAFFTGLMNTYSSQIDSGSHLVAFSEGIQNYETNLRFLFVNPTNNKKVSVLAHLDNKPALVIDSVLDENSGLYDMNDVKYYARVVEKSALTYPDQLKNAKAIYGLMNSSHVLTYFAISTNQIESVILVTFEIALQNGKIQTLLESKISDPCQKLDAKGNCDTCKPDTIGLMSKCYDQIKNCWRQIGSLCLSCQNEYSLVGNVCTNDCGLLM